MDKQDPLRGITYYLVGGAVRDALLNLPVIERDYVVVGSTPNALLTRGFVPVGQDFPVFLHPISKEEYALARTERKSGRGYTGFVCDASEDVTLEEDLLRRDLTINAIAQDKNGQLIDPFNGLKDLETRTLRHVSEAFVEDPLRVLRVARFAARFAHLGFTIADDTLALMKMLAGSGELTSLTPERVWMETEKALTTDAPAVYFEVLKECKAFDALFPEFHSGTRTTHQHSRFMPALRATHKQGAAPVVRFIVAQADLNQWQDETSQKRFSLTQKMRPPKLHEELAIAGSQLCDAFAKSTLSAEALLNALHGLDAFRRPERWEYVREALIFISSQRDWENRADLVVFSNALVLLNSLKVKDVIAEGYQHQAIGQELDRRRTQILASALIDHEAAQGSHE
ncbi:CCA tRNA nucleotidyltransferase [Aliidiomarina sanyensis]|uniref:CCA tRNA nucleotidyltransferase n=1 Tax=Aliidiomarina sanyensis TaxID=1249555 RepID=UPI0023B8BA93|nr:CCA tRNA nucleotidyltransferase [Aliidiomarina sanyensis]